MEPWGTPGFNGQERIRSLSQAPVGEIKEKSEKSVKKRISKGISDQRCQMQLRDAID